MKKAIKTVITVVLVLGIAALIGGPMLLKKAGGAAGGPPVAPAGPPAAETVYSVKVQELKTGSLRNYLELTGDVVTETNVAIFPDTGGKLAEVFVRVGDQVVKGKSVIATVDPSFAPDSFLSGARTAYEMIVGAFAAGDLSTLRRLLAPEVLANFEKAIRDRLAAEQTMTTTLVSIDAASVVEARLTGTLASVAVRFAAKLVSVTRDKAGAVVEGSPNDVVDHLDVWTFTRDVAAGDPNWLLAATQTVN